MIFWLTLPLLRLISSNAQDCKDFWNHLNPVMSVFIRKLSLSTLRWVPICQGLSHFSGFLHYFVFASRGMWESCQWLGVRWWFSPGTPVSSTRYNWLVMNKLQYGRKRDEKSFVLANWAIISIRVNFIFFIFQVLSTSSCLSPSLHLWHQCPWSWTMVSPSISVQPVPSPPEMATAAILMHSPSRWSSSKCLR